MAIEAKIMLEGVQLTWKEGDTTKTKVVSVADFARTLLQEVGLTVGPLPLAPDARGVRYIKQSDALYMYVEDPPRPIPTRFGQDNLNIVTPRCLWELKIVGASTQSGRLGGERLFALGGPLTHMSTNVYNFPFCNVYNTHRVCWGSNESVHDERQFSEFLEIPDIFWSSGFNGDLDRNQGHAVAGVEYQGTGAVMRAMHETGHGIDEDYLVQPRPFSQIVQEAEGAQR